jgi:hypothetical protein
MDELKEISQDISMEKDLASLRALNRKAWWAYPERESVALKLRRRILDSIFNLEKILNSKKTKMKRSKSF